MLKNMNGGCFSESKKRHPKLHIWTPCLLIAINKVILDYILTPYPSLPKKDAI